MEILGPVLGPIRDALPKVKRKSFPGMSPDEADSFELGYWAGVMAAGVVLMDETASESEIAERVAAEFKRIAAADQPTEDDGGSNTQSDT